MLEIKKSIEPLIKVLILLIIFQKLLVAQPLPTDESNQSKIVSPLSQHTNQPPTTQEEIALGSLTQIGILILVVLTSLLGSLFLKNQLNDLSQL